MKSWIDIYPHTVHASVLLLDNKIENWKVGKNKWNDIGHITSYWKIDRINDYKIETKSWEVNNREEHNLIFTELSKEWFKQWDVAEDFIGSKPY